jgi:hypothetical protein
LGADEPNDNTQPTDFFGDSACKTSSRQVTLALARALALALLEPSNGTSISIFKIVSEGGFAGFPRARTVRARRARAGARARRTTTLNPDHGPLEVERRQITEKSCLRFHQVQLHPFQDEVEAELRRNAEIA